MNVLNINPIEWINTIFSSLGSTIVLSSYWICLIGGMIGLVLYIFGYKNGKNFPLISIALYMIINIVGRMILGV